MASAWLVALAAPAGISVVAKISVVRKARYQALSSRVMALNIWRSGDI